MLVSTLTLKRGKNLRITGKVRIEIRINLLELLHPRTVEIKDDIHHILTTFDSLHEFFMTTHTILLDSLEKYLFLVVIQLIERTL